MADRQSEGSSKKRKFDNSRVQHGSRNKKGDLGRKEWSRQKKDRRAQQDDESNKRQKTDHAVRAPALPKPFSEEEVKAEERRPKHKVAVMVGYSGTGYRGMQISNQEKTIEGDLFTAFVAAGAIAKANADDPKKSQLVRCARTDKGVHAAGNVISLKLIVEDKDIVQKINAALSPQIRVWGICRTVNSFSAYQACDSRWYEYLIPTHSFIPPHPSSWLAKRLGEIAVEAGDREGYDARQKEVAAFWAETEEKYIMPILDELPDDLRAKVSEALYECGVDPEEPGAGSAEDVKRMVEGVDEPTDADIRHANGVGATETSGATPLEGEEANKAKHTSDPGSINDTDSKPVDTLSAGTTASDFSPEATTNITTPDTDRPNSQAVHRRTLDLAIKKLRQAYRTAKRAHRISPARLSRIQPILASFLGTRNFHNYTIQKEFRDPSAKRVIKSFTLNETPIVIDGTEWLSIKIHGQSFMMHQIRKMVGMVALVIRCGCDPARIPESFRDVRMSIPKAPSLGLLLERPVFGSYNEGAAKKHNREPLEFTPYETELEEFKQREIYERIYREENEENAFHQYLAHIDNFQDPQFLYLSSGGFGAVKVEEEKRRASGKGVEKTAEVESEDEGKGVAGDGEEG